MAKKGYSEFHKDQALLKPHQLLIVTSRALTWVGGGSLCKDAVSVSYSPR